MRPSIRYRRSIGTRSLLALAKASYICGPLAPVAVFFVAFMVLFSLSRMALAAYFWPHLRATDGVLWLIPVGLRMDIIALCLFTALPFVALLLLPRHRLWSLRHLLAGYLAAVASVFCLVELVSAPYLIEFTARPVLHVPSDNPAAAWRVLRDGYLALLPVIAVVASLCAYVTWRVVLYLLRDAPAWRLRGRVLMLPAVAGLLFLGGRSDIGPAAANPALAAFSDLPLANEIAQNSAYAALFSVYRDATAVDVKKLYGTLPHDEIIARVRAQMRLPLSAFNHETLPTLHAQPALRPRARPLNLVIIVAESFGAAVVGALGGLPVTPNFDRLARQGIFFTHLLATGTRTNRGLEAMVSGYIPSPEHATVLKGGKAQRDFFTIAQLLRRHGYDTGVVYGGDGHYDNMTPFFLSNGFRRFIDQRDYDTFTFKNRWGVCDEDLFAKALTALRTRKQPFFEFILTLSHHPPYEFPQGRVPLYDSRDIHVPANTARYADYALGQFFARAREQDYFDNTVFVIVADHPVHGSVNGPYPFQRMRIPALILGPGIEPRRIDRLASQIDLLPTVVGLLGIDTVHPMIGRNVLALSEELPGHAVMQYDDAYAYRRGDQVVVYPPRQAARQYEVSGPAPAPVKLDRELYKDGLAHILLPALLYSERRYRLPD